jgi:hypothetical protein
MMISIPPIYAVSQVIGFIKGKSAIRLARVYGERKRNFVGQHLWVRDRRAYGRAILCSDALRCRRRSKKLMPVPEHLEGLLSP